MKKQDVSGQDLISNLESQVTALDEYSNVINSLDGRIDDEGLMNELREVGVKSLGELQALNSLSDAELEKYAGLYQEKFKKAKFHTDEEMSPMIDEIDEKLIKLREDTEKQLDKLNDEWQKKIKQVVGGVDKEFDSMRQVGIDAIDGLEGGKLSMESSLMATARRIANSVRDTIQSALDINSPSRVMRNEVGKMIPAGIALGIEDNARTVYKALENMSDKMMNISTPEMALGTSRMAYTSNVVPASSGSSITNRNSKSYSPTIQNYFKRRVHTVRSG